ncbi:response regulator transcription factor [Terrisporobacter sp.]
MKIVIVEDNEKIRNELSTFLKKYGYETVIIEDFNNAVEKILSKDAHLVLLDINLPQFDGYYICREIRSKSNIPIIVVTSRDNEVDELMSMNLGADDFITKPYNTQILLARVVSLLKRSYKQENNELLHHKGITLNLGKSLVIYKDKEIELSKNELKILHLLMKNKEIILSRDEIMDALWQTNEFIDDNTLTVNVNRLRKKLESIGVNDYIITKRGQGYIV